MSVYPRAQWAAVRLLRMSSSVWHAMLAVAIIATISISQPRAAPPAPAGDVIAKIALLRAAHVGDAVRLASIGANVQNVHFEWRLNQRPALSKANLSDSNSAQTSFQADAPGIYVVSLTVRLKNRSATATIDVTATDPGPLVAIDTIDVDAQGHPGMSIGGQFYKDPGSGPHLQTLVLDRNSLEFVDNRTFALTTSGLSSMQSYLGGLDASRLVLVAMPSSSGTFSNSSLHAPLNAALAEIGAVAPIGWVMGTGDSMSQCWTNNSRYCTDGAKGWQESTTGSQGSFSAIGVPGMAAGSGWYDDALQHGTTEGALIGYLTPSENVTVNPYENAYTFVFPADEFVQVDTCASGGPSACVIQVGSQTFAPQGTNGINVVLLNRVTLKLIAHQTVTSTTSLENLLHSLSPSSASGHFFAGASGFLSDRVVVLMQSVGNNKLTFDGATPLLQTVDQLGGTPETFGPAITQGQPYALVGVAGNLPWHGRGIESSPVVSQAMGVSMAFAQPGHSRGELARDRRGRYTPVAGDPVGGSNLELFPIVFQDPTPWPYEGNCAIPYFADQMGIGVGYPDVRSVYQNSNIDITTLHPDKVPYPGTLANYCAPVPTLDEFRAIQTQLDTEIDSVSDVRTFIANLSSPFVESQSSDTVIVAQIADDIYQSVKPPSNANTGLSWSSVFDLAAATSGLFIEGSDPAVGLVVASANIATQLTASTPAGDPSEQIFSTALELSSELNQQMLTHLDALGNLESILVADSGKLSTVEGKLKSGAWPWQTNVTTSHVVEALNASTSQAVYSAFLPPTWPLVNLKPDLATQFSSADVTKFRCYHAGLEHAPFASALEANQFHSLFQLMPGTETSDNEVWTFGSYDVTTVTTKLPGTSLTDSLFSTMTGGAGAYKPAWYRSTYNPPAFVRCGDSSSNPSTEQHGAPVIPPAEAAYTLG